MSEEEQKRSNYQSSSDNYERFTVSINPAIYRELEARAKAEKRTKSFYVEEALSLYFSNPPGEVQQVASSSHQDESSGLQEAIQQMKEELFSRMQAQQDEISILKQQQDALLQQSASSPGISKNQPAAKKNHPASTDISSIEEIQSDKGYPVNEASAILERLANTPMTPDALKQRIKRGFQKENLKPEDIGYKDAEGFHILGSYLLHYIRQDASQKPL